LDGEIKTFILLVTYLLTANTDKQH
jgi:hypothetical protein